MGEWGPFVATFPSSSLENKCLGNFSVCASSRRDRVNPQGGRVFVALQITSMPLAATMGWLDQVPEV